MSKHDVSVGDIVRHESLPANGTRGEGGGIAPFEEIKLSMAAE